MEDTGVSINDPQNARFILENPTNMDDFVPLFLETSILLRHFSSDPQSLRLFQGLIILRAFGLWRFKYVENPINTLW